MAVLQTSGSYSATPTVIDLLNASLRIAQVIGAEETATGAQLQNAMDAMAAMVKAWQASGIHVWCEEECILFLQPGQTQYQIGAGSADHCTLWNSAIITNLSTNALAGATSITVDDASEMNIGDSIGIQVSDGTNFWTTVASTITGSVVPLTDALPTAASDGSFVFDYTVGLYRPLRIMGARRYNYLSRIDLNIQMWARLDYQNQTNKYTLGIPTAFFYDPQTGQGQYTQPIGQYNSWPTPQDNTNAARFTAQRPIQDIASLADIPDFPVEWNAALKWNLALEIGPENGVPMEQLGVIVKQAERWYQLASAWDRESESLLFGVAFTPGARRG